MTPKLQGSAFYRLMSFSCAMAFLTFGYDAGVLGGVQTTKPFLDAIGNPSGSLIIPLIASSYTLGCLVMSLFLAASDFGSRFGRRMSILGGDICVIIGGLLQATSYCKRSLTHTWKPSTDGEQLWHRSYAQECYVA